MMSYNFEVTGFRIKQSGAEESRNPTPRAGVTWCYTKHEFHETAAAPSQFVFLILLASVLMKKSTRLYFEVDNLLVYQKTW